MTVRPDVSVIIPVHNAGGTVGGLVRSALTIDALDVEVVVVDDASTDDSVAQVEALGRAEVVVERFSTNAGAGVARNRGFERATGRYALFFDADDELHPDSLVAAVRGLEDTGADVAVLPYRYRRGGGGAEGMNSFDAAVWTRYATGPRRLTRLGEVPSLLGCSNYPWNKVVRTDHYRRTGLRFSGTVVHNDILGHWLTLLDAETVLLLDQPLCTHIVNVGARNLTNRESRARLSLFDALDETYTALERRPEKRARYAHHYWDFVLRVGGWATSRVTPDVADEFSLRLQEHLLRIDLGDLTRIRLRHDTELATRLVRRALA
ncbi:glycosyltransferase [Microlunatus flavus]|uniref:Glycosyl transferase family 2 n=1 Tax=Microlunatus flavus TaxID=1036181 RepID=A0A1H8Z3K3_9ACTN|nr:glycosyltransferase family 2 protein [Microlunatus flavus]SEP59000.1 Glycosyl transferase family 2 [Microlunatus flavus]